MSKEIVLITGGSGFIGRHLTNELIQNGYKVKIVDVVEPGFTHSNLEYHSIDYTSRKHIKKVLENCSIVFHLASSTLPQSSNLAPLSDITTNLEGAIKLLESSAEKDVRKFFFASSGGTVYGEHEHLPVSETAGTNPTCSYGIVKLAIEKYLRLFNQTHQLNTCSLRISNPYGEFQNPHRKQGAIPIFCYKALKNEAIDIWGDGTISRDFIHVKDVVRAMRLLIENDHSYREINIGSGVGTSLNTIIDEIENITSKKLSINFLPKRDFDIQKIWLDTGRINSLAGWAPEISLHEGISQLISWLTKNSFQNY